MYIEVFSWDDCSVGSPWATFGLESVMSKFTFDESTLRILLGDEKMEELLAANKEAERQAALAKKFAERADRIKKFGCEGVDVDKVIKTAETLAAFLIENAKPELNGYKRVVHKFAVQTEYGDVSLRVTL